MIQRELTLTDYIAILRRRWVLITAIAVIGGPLTYGVSLLLPNRYQSQTLVLVQQATVPSDFVKPVDSSDISQRLASMQQQILSRSRLEPIIHEYGLYPKDVNRLPMDDLIVRLQKSIDVSPILPMAETRSSELPGFYVKVTLDNPYTAQKICSSITSMFIEESGRLRQKHSEDTTQFLVQQLAESKAKLDEQDAKLAAFKSHYIGSLPDEEQGNLNLLMGLTSQLDAATQALARAQQDKGFAQSLLTQQIGAWKASQAGQNPETLDLQLAALQTQLANLQAKYTDDHPDVVKAKSDIATLQKRIAENASPNKTVDADKTSNSVEPAQIMQLRAQVHSDDQIMAEKTKEQEQIRAQIQTYQNRIQSSPAVEQQYKELTRGYQTALDSYNDLQKKRDQSAMTTDLERKQEGEQFRVLDPANLPEKPSFPNRPLCAAGGLAGGVALGLGLAFFLETRDTSFRTETDVEFSLQLPVLATIPAIESLLAKPLQRSTPSLRKTEDLRQMYQKFFGLRESPFNMNPDPRYLFLTKQIQEALAGLTYGIQNRKGFILLTGEVGTGKTTLLNRLLDWLRGQRVATAFVFNSQVNTSQLFDFVMADFAIPCETRHKSQVLLKLNAWLLDRYRAGETAVLIVDEAQNLSLQVLEEIRLLTNLETSTEKLLQIVLTGQPELEEKLKLPQLRQLRQRIALRCHTGALTLEETFGYIAERLRIAGAGDEPIFSREAIETVHLYSRGIPRIINLLCEHALINSYVDHVRPIPTHLVEEVAREFQLDEIEPIAPVESVSAMKKSVDSQVLLQNLDELLGRLREASILPATGRERKP
jgi:polysaccharide chain length determinant protein (PEP-CTERM system associated)